MASHITENPGAAGTGVGDNETRQAGRRDSSSNTLVCPRHQQHVGGRAAFKALMRLVKLDPATGCWLWCGRRDRDGYGRAYYAGRSWLAHRLAYELCVGPIPPGLELDHIVCDRPGCIRPDHVRPSTHYENTMRGNSPAARNARKRACDHGHAFDAQNTYRLRNRRYCRACNRLAVRRYAGRQS